MILDLVRTTLHTAITTPIGDGFAALRVPKGLARRLNITFGSPLCSGEELEKRKNARTRLKSLRGGASARNAPRREAATAAAREAAPVMVYFEKERNVRELVRIEELLKAKNIAYTRLDVTGDEATTNFVMREAKCESDDLPVVFVAGVSVGNYAALVAADVSGDLAKAINA